MLHCLAFRYLHSNEWQAKMVTSQQEEMLVCTVAFAPMYLLQTESKFECNPYINQVSTRAHWKMLLYLSVSVGLASCNCAQIHGLQFDSYWVPQYIWLYVRNKFTKCLCVSACARLYVSIGIMLHWNKQRKNARQIKISGEKWNERTKCSNYWQWPFFSFISRFSIFESIFRVNTDPNHLKDHSVNFSTLRYKTQAI